MNMKNIVIKSNYYNQSVMAKKYNYEYTDHIYKPSR